MFGGLSGRMKVPSQMHFANVPSINKPRSAFDRSHTHKTTGQCGTVIPYFVDEILPGDTCKFQSTIFCRLLTPLYPAMDNLEVKTEYFFVPNRLVWNNWVKFMGEQASPGDSISYTIPQVAIGSYAVGTLGDYLLTGSLVNYGGTAGKCSALPFRGYGLIFNQWYRDENLVNPQTVALDDGPDALGTQSLFNRANKHDYFWSCLNAVQKGTAVPLLSGAAFVKGQFTTVKSDGTDANVMEGVSGTATIHGGTGNFASTHNLFARGTQNLGQPTSGDLYVDLTTNATDTINTLRLAVTTQQFLENDMRGGTRYTESCLAHFGVSNPDARLQRTEYLGGGSAPVNITPIPATGFSSGSNHTGDLGGVIHAMSNNHGFTKTFTEHGHVFGMVTVRVAALTYQQGLHKMWGRQTRYDFYFPEFANLGEQAVKLGELYYQGDAAGANHDADTFGYQERWAEYRYFPNRVSGLFRSSAPSTLDAWHFAVNYGSTPALNATFLPDASATIVDRNLSVTHSTTVHQFKLDIYNTYHHARVMPVRSVPGVMRL